MLFGNALANGVGQIVIFAGATLVASAFTWGAVSFDRRRKSTSNKIDRMYVALVGAEISDTDPMPAIGLIRDFAEQKEIISELVPAVAEIQENIKALIADSLPNGGTTSRDKIDASGHSLDRIEAQLGTTPQRESASVLKTPVRRAPKRTTPK